MAWGTLYFGVRTRKKIPQSARLCAGGGVQSLFGQCLNRHRMKLYGASLKKFQNFWAKKIGPIAFFTMRGGGGGGGGREINDFGQNFVIL